LKNVYLDNNATTQVASEVIDAMMPFFRDLWGNPSSMHVFGGQVTRHMEEARGKVADLIGASPSEIVFTSCGTESDNTAIRGTLEAAGRPMRIITTRVEHPAVLNTCRHFKETGYDVVEIGVNHDGDLNLDELRDEVAKGPALVSVMWANNETGVIFPIREIAEIVKGAGCVMHTDAVQAAGKLDIDMEKVPVDMLSLSGHKLHAPKGIGVLYIRRGTRINPLLLGGHHEGGKRAGTENIPYIVGLGKACDLARKNMSYERKRVAELRDKLEDNLLKSCPDATVNGNRKNRLPNTSNMSFHFIEGEAILYHLSDYGIAASSGSACSSGSLEPSHVIRAMGVPFTASHGSIRFSLSRYTTSEEIEYVAEKMPGIVNLLRNMSPFV